MSNEHALQVDRALERYGADLWLTRRLNLDEVLLSLRSLLNNPNLVYRDSIQDGIKFIQFLESNCSGHGFSNDKQWSQLMNLMQISRKLNHKSVRFRDILANKRLIQANANDIIRFNESIRLASVIEILFKELESNLSASHLQLTSGLGKPDPELDRSDNRMLDHISQSQRGVETALMPALHNLRLHLQNELVTRDECQRHHDWLMRLTTCTRSVELIRIFLDDYYRLKKNLVQLRPLVGGLGDENDQQAGTRLPKLSRNSQLLANSLNKCKQDFRQVLEYDNALELSMKDLVKKSSKVTSRPVVKSKSSKSANGHVDVLKLHLLIDPKKPVIVNNIFGTRLSEALTVLNDCCKTLDRVMSTLRLEYGRFYFVNDLELLEIISLDTLLVQECEQASNQRLIVKLFNNSIESFILNGSRTHIVGIRTPTGEEVLLSGGQEPVPLQKPVNIYSLVIVRILNELTRKLQRSLKSKLIKSLTESGEEVDWLLPIQMMSLAEKVKFTQNVELTFDLPNLLTQYENQLKILSEIKRTDSTQLELLKQSEAISLSVHFVSTLMELIRLEVRSISDWHWQKLARYYRCRLVTDGTDEIKICLANSSFIYKFDLLPIETSSSSTAAQGVSIKRLIYTKTSERCFLVASQAIGRLKLGASPYGPAGSGKTETVKALGQILGCQVIVHNCDETNDARSLERLIWGLAHTGLWGCFDEFNRLGSDTLSSVSAVLEVVQGSLRQCRTTLELEGGEIRSIDQDSAFFITMNPGDSNKYRGRRRLPANLRSLFLPVAMVDVQVDMIVREMLLAHSAVSYGSGSDIGIELAATLSQKISKWIVWMRAYLVVSRCEWDLRLVMVILKRFKIYLAVDHSAGESLDHTLVKSISSEVLPRLSLSHGEVEIFHRSLEEVFALDTLVVAKETFEDQVQQLKDQLLVRSGIILLDSSRSGQSGRLWRSLAVTGDEHIKTFALNPKAYKNLFGYFEESQENEDVAHGQQQRPNKWIDGLLTHLVRESLKLLQLEDTHQVWLILDGSLDPDWIESLNSVLDDNTVLTLSSGERLNFVHDQGKKCIKLIFVTDTLANVSPATVSRVGLLNLEQNVTEESESCQLHELTVANVDHERVATADLLRQRMCPTDEFDVIEYNCSDLSTSAQLSQVLDSANLLRGTTKLILINNWTSIGPEDKWQTRTFHELLKFAISYGCYYDVDFRLRKLPPDIRFVLTVTDQDELQDAGLCSLVNERIDLSADSRPTVRTVSLNDLQAMLGVEQSDVGVVLIYNEDDETRSSLKTIESQCLRQANGSTSAEILSFNCSLAVEQSLDRLRRLAQQQTLTKVESVPKRILYLIDSLHLKLMDPKHRQEFYHLLNVIRFAKIKINLIALFGREADARSALNSDHRFLSSLADQALALSTSTLDETYYIGYLFGEHTTRSSNLRVAQLLVSFFKRKPASKSFLSTLKEMISTTKSHVKNQKDMLSNSLSQLELLEKSVEETKSRKSDDEKSLAKRRQDIEALLSQINKEVTESEERSLQVQKLKQSQEQKTRDLEISRTTLQRELKDVLPAIEASRLEVSRSLKPEALNEIKTLRSPPKTVEDILFVLLIFLDPTSNASWTSMKMYLTRQSLRDEMTNYDFENRLSADLLQKIEREISNRKDSFQHQRANRASSAVVPILNWIQAARQYGQVLIKLKPLTDGMHRLETESKNLITTAQELEREHADLEQRVSSDKVKLADLETGFTQARDASSRVREDLDKAQAAIGNLSHQMSSWRAKLAECEAWESNDWVALYEASLICSSVACYARDYGGLEQIFQVWSDILGDSIQPKSLKQFLCDLMSLVIESVDEDAALELRLHLGQDDSLAVQESRDQLARIFIAKLNLHFNQDKTLYLNVSPSITSTELTQYLAFKRILCARPEQLMLIETTTTTSNWRQVADSVMQMSDRISIFNVTSTDATLLDIFDYISTRDSSGYLPRRTILYNQSGRSPSSELSPLICVLTIEDDKSSNDESSASEPLGYQLADYLIEMQEPTIGVDIQNLELELSQKQRQVRTLEANLVKSLMVSGNANAQLQGELVRLLGDLRKSSLALDASIAEITTKLANLQARRQKFEAAARQASDFYACNMSRLRKLDLFYHMPLRHYAKLVLSATSKADNRIDWTALMTKVLCPMRSRDRNAFRDQLSSWVARARPHDSSPTVANAPSRALKQAADLRSNLTSLMNSPLSNATTTISSQMAIILHDASKSGPQLEIDELMRGQTEPRAQGDSARSWNYQVLYATNDGQLLGSQLEKALAASSNGNRQCVCVANAHLASRWLNERLSELIESRLKSSRGSGRFLLILVAESQGDRDEESSSFGSNLLDKADLKFWYDGLALKFTDRFRLYERLILDKEHRASLRNVTRELVLFHVVCQELTKEFESDHASTGTPERATSWHHGNKYNFDYGQLSFAQKILQQIYEAETDLAQPAGALRHALCHYLGSIVYGSRLETRADEELLEKLLDKFLRTHEQASCQMATLDRLLRLDDGAEAVGVAAFSAESQLVVANLIRV